MLSGRLWPAHPHPLPDELLSCWLVRIAHANGLKIQTFCQHEFGAQYQIWNRDIDRGAPAWLLRHVTEHTGQSEQRVTATTLNPHQGTLFGQQNKSGQLRWILPLNIYHRTRLGFGLQFCPRCLASPPEPYYRRAWRVGFYTFCPIHGMMLLDRCPNCGKGIAFHRTELGHRESGESIALNHCGTCGFDLAQASSEPIDEWDQEVFTSWRRALSQVCMPATDISVKDGEWFAILHHFCALCVSRRLALKLYPYLCDQTGRRSLPLTSGRIAFEQRPIAERHHIIGLGWWLLGRWPQRLRAAHRDKAVRYNVLFKDFDDYPNWYTNAISAHLTTQHDVFRTTQGNRSLS